MMNMGQSRKHFLLTLGLVFGKVVARSSNAFGA